MSANKELPWKRGSEEAFRAVFSSWKIPTPRKSGEAGILTTESRRHGEQQQLLKRRGMKEAMRLPTLHKSGERAGPPAAGVVID